MISKLSHVSVFVLNQDSAYDFYVNKLGFKVHTDAPMGPGMRWLTVTPPEQPALEITLMAIGRHEWHIHDDFEAKFVDVEIISAVLVEHVDAHMG